MKDREDRHSAASVARRPSISVLRDLYAWFARNGARGPSAAYETMLDFLADALRIHPLKEDVRDERILGAPFQLALRWVEAWLGNERLEDDLGTVMEVDAAAMSSRQSQFLTPMNLARMNAEVLFARAEPPPAGQVLRTLDPACGTGRLLMACMEKTAPWDDGWLVYCAVDLDMRMVRTTILNLDLARVWRLKNKFPPALFEVAWGDFLQVDFGQAEAWKHANRWDPPHWSELPKRGPLVPFRAERPLAEVAAPALRQSVVVSEAAPPARKVGQGVIDVEPAALSVRPTVVDAEVREAGRRAFRQLRLGEEGA